ncbi:type VII toxin-antitoxin system HepT family RNase toxin [Thermodesulfovibrio yellowstonii]|uniref:type VII toxin-antitoxin system HepT family RNase toxin n=1 Tax=Thermodesulfovibrio yellowstonii TaxID=28262 RepID=UPI003C7AF046
MNIDVKRISQYIYEIKENTDDIKSILEDFSPEEILNNKRILKALKFNLVEIAESISLTIQHILAKNYGIPVKGYIDTIKKAKEKNIIDESIYVSLKPFFDFRNILIHRYWEIDDSLLLKNVKENLESFYQFIETIREKFIK